MLYAIKVDMAVMADNCRKRGLKNPELSLSRTLRQLSKEAGKIKCYFLPSEEAGQPHFYYAFETKEQQMEFFFAFKIDQNTYGALLPIEEPIPEEMEKLVRRKDA